MIIIISIIISMRIGLFKNKYNKLNIILNDNKLIILDKIY